MNINLPFAYISFLYFYTCKILIPSLLCIDSHCWQLCHNVVELWELRLYVLCFKINYISHSFYRICLFACLYSHFVVTCFIKEFEWFSFLNLEITDRKLGIIYACFIVVGLFIVVRINFFTLLFVSSRNKVDSKGVLDREVTKNYGLKASKLIRLPIWAWLPT